MAFFLQGSTVNKPDRNPQQNIEFIPLTVPVAAMVQGHPTAPTLLLCLLDSGDTGCWLSQK